MNDKNKNNVVTGGISGIDLLQIAFIVLNYVM